MSALYHLTILPPPIAGCDAVLQQVRVLQEHWGGRIVWLNPNGRLPLYVPRVGFGVDQLRLIRNLEAHYQVHHVFNPDPYPFPLLRLLRRPIIYSLTTGIKDGPLDLGHKQLYHRPHRAKFLASLDAVTAADDRTCARMRSWGLENVHQVLPGIDTSRFTLAPVPLQRQVRLMVGSAPWSRAQFRQKGIDALLSAAQRMPHLHLVFLWRGVLAEEMQDRVRQLGLKDQVQVLNERVDVNQVLAGVHASVVLATDPSVIVPYPHSLIESLGAGKPVITSPSIAMADYVRQTGCGTVTKNVTTDDILAAVDELRQNYSAFEHRAQEVRGGDFTESRMVESFRAVYEHVLSS